MRRLPIFLLVDVSESMVGECLYKLEEGIGKIASSLRIDPHALETVFLSVIVFAGKPRTIVPLTELATFYPPSLPVGGGTALGAALDHMMDEIDRNVAKNKPDCKGDWKPIVFLLTDGHSTDDVSGAVARWNQSYRRQANLVAVSIGGGADHDLLTQLTEDVMVFNDTAADAFAQFIHWISQTMSRSASSKASEKVSLAKPVPGVVGDLLSPEALANAWGVDDRFAVFVGKCAKNALPYVVKYERRKGQLRTSDPTLAKMLETESFALTSAVPVKHSFFELSDEIGSGRSVNSDELIGQPTCPHCGAPFGMAMCSCGGIHCIDGDGEASCPWCGKVGTYRAESTGDGFDIERGRG